MAVSIPHVCEFWYTAIFGPVKCTSLIICQGQLQRRKNAQIVQKVLKVRGRAGRWSSRSRSKSSIRRSSRGSRSSRSSRRSSRGSRSSRRRRRSMRAWEYYPWMGPTTPYLLRHVIGLNEYTPSNLPLQSAHSDPDQLCQASLKCKIRLLVLID